MFLGHFGLGFAGKRVAPELRLGTLFLAVQWADLLFWILALFGVEHFRISSGTTRLTPMDFYDYPWSHSLAALIVWGVLIASIYAITRGGIRAAIIVGVGVVSHWFLDAAVHRPDMPVLPRGPYVGLGLWNSIPATVIAELALYGGGILLYTRATRPIDRTGSWALWILAAFLGAAWIGSVAGPPPPDERTVELTGVAMWLLVPWGYWIDRHRTVARA